VPIWSLLNWFNKAMEREIHTINAKGKSLGRLATQISILLRGKHKPDFAPHKDEGDFVVVEDLVQIKLTGKKEEQKLYHRHSGYIGSLKSENMKNLERRKPGEILRKAVLGMLPKNKLRTRIIKRLTIKR